MKVLHLIPHLSQGGAERQLSYLAPELVRMGHDIHIAYSYKGPHVPELPGVILHKLKSNSNYDPFLFVQIIQLIRKIKPNVVHTWITQMDILGGVAARLCRVPWVIREPNQSLAYDHSWKNLLRIRVVAGAAAIVANSRGGKDYWAKKLFRSDICIVPNGLPLVLINSVGENSQYEVADTNIPLILYAGRMEDQKRQNIFLNAMALLKKKMLVRGMLCGDGPRRVELEMQSKSLGIDSDIHFTGYLSAKDLWAVMKRASLFMSLSAYEGCPNTVMEAMACGCPLVVSDIPAHREILDETSAFFVNPMNLEELVLVVSEALLNKEEALARAAIAKRKAQEWSISNMAKNFEKAYIDCCEVDKARNR